MLQTILSVAVAQFDIYSDKLLSFPHLPFAHIFALKKQDMSDFSFPDFVNASPKLRFVAR